MSFSDALLKEWAAKLNCGFPQVAEIFADCMADATRQLRFAAVFISYIDRTNISVAAIAMKDDLGWTETQKGIVLSSFFVGYLLLMAETGAAAVGVAAGPAVGGRSTRLRAATAPTARSKASTRTTSNETSLRRSARDTARTADDGRAPPRAGSAITSIVISTCS